ncbi:MAG: hypothetical protein P4L45_08720 [Ignavibacteriaceae bacterium]|nr:hypothetical protein [Ignavibacteriaceae bacterium]
MNRKIIAYNDLPLPKASLWDNPLLSKPACPVGRVGNGFSARG